MNADAAFLVAKAALEAIRTYYGEQGIVLPDERQLVVSGLPSWDCEQVTIQVETVSAQSGDPTLPGLTSREADPAFSLRTATLGITIARCIPLSDDGSAPADDDEEATSILVYGDIGHVWNALVEAQDAGLLPCCGGIGFLSWQGLGPEGGLVGGLQRIAVSLE